MGLELSDRTSRDLHDYENRQDLAHQYRRAEAEGSDAALAAWARRWGEPVMLRLNVAGPGQMFAPPQPGFSATRRKRS